MTPPGTRRPPWNAPPVRTGGEPEPLVDPVRPAERLVRVLVPRFARFAAVYMDTDRPFEPRVPSPHGRRPLHRVAAAEDGESLRCGHLTPPGAIVHWSRQSPVLAALDRGEVVHIPRLDAATAGHLAAQLAAPELAATPPGTSVLLFPMPGLQAAPLGLVLLMRGPDRPPFGDGEIELIAELSGWTAEELRRAGLCHDEHRIAAELHYWTRAAVPARGPGIELRCRSAPHGLSGRLGGDWTDVIALPGGRTGLVIGDVAGHGATAAVLMSRFQTMVRTLASIDLPPDRLLCRLDLLARRLDEDHGWPGELLATCLYAVYDPEAGQCRVACAGHVPPVLATPGGTVAVLRPPTGVPLGVGGAGFEACTFDAPAGSVLALCTDGLVEAVAGPHGDVERGLHAVAARLAGPQDDLERICDELVRPPARDDVTLLVARLLGTGAAAGRSARVPAPRRAAAGRDTRPAPRRDVPADADSFVGRDRQLARLRRMLGENRLVTVTGPAGVGKSRLVRQAVADLSARFPDGVRLIELSEIWDPALLPGALAAALGASAQPARRIPELIRDHLADRHALLVLDTCEHLLDATAELVDLALRTAPLLGVLVTGRRPLHAQGEHTLLLPPLPVRRPDAAVRLFLDRAAAVVPEAAFSAADLDVVRRLCARLDGLPLAIELAAAKLRNRSLAELEQGLADRFELLSGDARAWGGRNWSLGASISWSHALCTPLERLMWARLAAFPDGFELADAERLCAGETLTRSDVLHLIGELVDQSILIRDGRGAATRYRMLESIREYGRHRLTAPV